jgi:SAM-dependent methyltransferase
MSDRRNTLTVAMTQAPDVSRQTTRFRTLKKQLVSFWNTHSLYWDSISRETSAASPLRERAASFIPDGSTVLDVACGSAANAYWIAGRCKYFGADISESGLCRATHPGLRLACADADQLPFANESFDAAISTFALEHSVNPVQMLSEMRRIVRPGGRVVLLGPAWDLPFWYPNAVQNSAQKIVWRLLYTGRRMLGQLGGLLIGRLPFFLIEDPQALHHDFVCDADAVYVVWSYEVILQMKRWGCRLIQAEVDDRMWGTRASARLLKRLLYRLPMYRYAGSTVLMVFQR